jgi:uncharacterized protein DUF5615
MSGLYVDHNVATEIHARLKTAGHSIITTYDLGQERAKDDEQLLTAARLGRIFVTHNHTDFELLHDAWRRWSSAWGVSALHPGILAVTQRLAASEAGQLLIEFLALNMPLENELYRWRTAADWQRRA